MNPLVKLIGGLVALILGFLAVFVPPVAVFIPGVVQFLAGIASALGLTSWRNKFELAKDWFKSKTIWGALLGAVPIIALAVFPFINFVPWEWLEWLLKALIVGGGATALYGIFDAVNKNKKLNS